MKITSIAALLAQIDRGQLRLPTYKRAFRWNSQQTLEYISSLYRSLPNGSLVFWSSITAEQTAAAGSAEATDYVVDGHQRLAVVYGAFRGYAPSFSPGTAALEWPLHYHVGYETFAFGTPAVKDDPLWINLPTFFAPQHPDCGNTVMSIYPHCTAALPLEEVMRRVSQLANLKDHRIVVEYMPDRTSLVDCEPFARYIRLLTPALLTRSGQAAETLRPAGPDCARRGQKLISRC